MNRLFKFLRMWVKYTYVFWKHSYAPHTAVMVYSSNDIEMLKTAKLKVRDIFEDLSNEYSAREVSSFSKEE